MHLAEGEVLRYSPDESDLLATERKVAALWKAIERARDAGDWRPWPEQALRLVQPQGTVPRSSAAPRRRCPSRRRASETLPSHQEAIPEPSLPEA